MARTLKQTVLAGGVLYSAGTPESDVKADVPDQFWDGQPDAPSGSSKAKSGARRRSQADDQEQ